MFATNSLNLQCPILHRPLFDAVKLSPCGHVCSQEAAKEWRGSICQLDLENFDSYTIDHGVRFYAAKQIYLDNLHVNQMSHKLSSETVVLISKGSACYYLEMYHKAIEIFAKILCRHPGLKEAKAYLGLAINAENPFDPVPRSDATVLCSFDLYKEDHNGTTLAHIAARSGNLEMVKKICEKDPFLFQAVDKNGYAPLHHAAKKGHFETVKWLFQQQPELFQTQDENCSTLIHCIASSGHLEMIKWFYKQEPRFFQIEDLHRKTPIHAVVENGDFEIIKWLYERESQLFQLADRDGKIPVHYLTSRTVSDKGLHYFEIEKWLYEQNSQLFQIVDNFGKTAVHSALESGHFEIVKWIYHQGPHFFQNLDNQGETFTHCAAHLTDPEIAKWLYRQESKLFQIVDKHNKTPLHAAAKRGNLDLIKWLYEKAPLLFQKNSEDDWTPLDWIQYGDSQIVNWFYEQNPFFFQNGDIITYTTLHHAASHGLFGLVKWLYKKNPQLFLIRDNIGRIASHFAASGGDLQIIKWLYQQDPNYFTLEDEAGRAATHFAASEGNLEILKWLYQQDPSLFQKTTHAGWTPLYFAANNSHLPVVEWLYEQDPFLFQKEETKKFKTIGHLISENHVKVVKSLNEQDPLVEKIFQKINKAIELDPALIFSIQRCGEPYYLQSESATPDELNNIFNFVLTAKTLSASFATDQVLNSIMKYCPNIISLDLSGCNKITDEGLKIIAKHCAKLTSLKMSDCHLITDEGVCRIAKFCPYLIEIDVRGCSKLTDEGLFAMIRLCKKLTKFRTSYSILLTEKEISRIIFLSKMQSESHFSKFLTQVLSYNPSLSFKDCANVVTDEVIQLIIKHCPLITSLDLSYCSKITDVALEAVVKYCKNITKLNLAFCSWKGTNSKTGISDLGVITMLQTYPELTHLDLTGCEPRAFGEYRKNQNADSQAYFECMDEIFKGIMRYCKHLTHLSLHNFRSFKYHLLLDVLNSCASLKKLHIPKITDIEITYDFMLKILNTEWSVANLLLPSIQSFTFSKNCCITDNEILLFIKHVANWIKLSRLDLSECDQITNQGFFFIVQKFPNLKELVIPKGRNILLTREMIEDLPLLMIKRIMLLLILPQRSSPSCLRAQDVEMLVELFSVCTQDALKEILSLIPARDISFTNSDITDSFIQLLLTYYSPISIDLKGCKKITDLTLFAIAENCTDIVRLDLHDCPLLTNEGLFTIVIQSKLIERLVLPEQRNISKQYIEKLTELFKTGEKSDVMRVMNQLIFPKRRGTTIQYLQQGDIQTIIELSKTCTWAEFEKAMSIFLPVLDISLEDCKDDITDEVIHLITQSCPISSLNLNGCRKITDRTLQSIAKFCTHLTGLHLPKDTPFTNQSLFLILKQCSQLKSLTLPSNLPVVSAEYIEMLADFFRTGSESDIKRVMDMLILPQRSNHLNSGDIQTIMRLSEICTEVELAKAMHSLIPTQNISFIDPKGVTDELAQLIASSCTFSSLDLSCCSNITNGRLRKITRHCRNTLEILNLAHCTQVTDRTIKKIISSCKKLTSINLTDCKNVTFKEFVALIKEDKLVLNLKIKIDISFIKSLIQLSKTESQSTITKIMDIFLSGTELNFQECPDAITDEVLELFAEHISRHPILSFNLAHCDSVTDKGFRYFAIHCPENILELNLEGCSNITTHGLLSSLFYFQEIQLLTLPNGTLIDTKKNSNEIDFDYSEKEKHYGTATYNNLSRAIEYPKKPFKRIDNPSNNLKPYYKQADYDPFPTRLLKRVVQYLNPIEYIQKEAEQGVLGAQIFLGLYYTHVNQDPEAVIKYSQMAADQGDAFSQNELGTYYIYVNVDLQKAVHYYQMAADQGDANGLYNLASCYEQGLGVVKDLTKAKQYFQMSSALKEMNS